MQTIMRTKQLRFNDEEYARIERWARKAGLKPVSWIKQAAMTYGEAVFEAGDNGPGPVGGASPK